MALLAASGTPTGNGYAHGVIRVRLRTESLSDYGAEVHVYVEGMVQRYHGHVGRSKDEHGHTLEVEQGANNENRWTWLIRALVAALLSDLRDGQYLGRGSNGVGDLYMDEFTMASDELLTLHGAYYWGAPTDLARWLPHWHITMDEPLAQWIVEGSGGELTIEV